MSYLNDIREDIDEGNNVIIVAHSQGTLYGNMVYENLTTSEKLHTRLVYVGAAAASVADGSSRWVTNPKDWVINSLRTLSFANNWAQPLA